MADTEVQSANTHIQKRGKTQRVAEVWKKHLLYIISFYPSNIPRYPKQEKQLAHP